MMKAKILIFGGSGLVGSRFLELNKDTFEMKSPPTSQIDILKADQISKAIEQFDPAFVINFAAYTNVEEAEKQKNDKESLSYQLNAVGAKNVADICKKYNLHLIHISTDYVFDGHKSESAYNEEDLPHPMNWYGQTKYLGEQYILGSGCVSAVIRISMPYSAHYDLKKDIARFFLGELKSGNKIKAIKDQRITPTYVSDIANALRVLINKESSGIYHVSSLNYTSAFNFAYFLAITFGIDPSLVKGISLEEYNKNKLAKILRFSWLDPAKFVGEFGEGILHTVEDSLKLFKQAVDGMSLN